MRSTSPRARARSISRARASSSARRARIASGRAPAPARASRAGLSARLSTPEAPEAPEDATANVRAANRRPRARRRGSRPPESPSRRESPRPPRRRLADAPAPAPPAPPFAAAGNPPASRVSSARRLSRRSMAPATVYPERQRRARSSASTETAAPATAPTLAPRRTETPRLAARAATAPASAPKLAPATANAPTSAPLNTVVAGAASRFTIFETLSCIVRWVVRASDRCIAASDSADGWRSICVSDASVSSRSRLASSRGVRRGSPATREHSHIEHHASARSSTCAHVSQLHVGASTAGDAVAVAAEAKRTGIFFRAKFWPAQQRAMLPFPNRRGRASRGVGEVGASLSSPREVNAHVSSRSTCSAVP